MNNHSPTELDADEVRKLLNGPPPYTASFTWGSTWAGIIFVAPHVCDGRRQAPLLEIVVPDAVEGQQRINVALPSRHRAPGLHELEHTSGWEAVTQADKAAVRLVLELIGEVAEQGYRIRTFEVGEPVDPRKVWATLLDHLASLKGNS